MKNYLESFIPKYQDPSGPLPSLVERNGVYYMVTDDNPIGQVVGEVPLSGTDPVGEFYVMGEVAGPLLKWFGKGLKWTGNLAWKGASKVAPKATGAVETAVKTASNAVKAGKDKVVTGVQKVLKRNSNGKVVEASDITDNFLKFVDLNPEIKGTRLSDEVIARLPNDERLLLKQLRDDGIDISKLTREHLTEALNKRAKLLYETAPNERHGIIFPKQTSGRTTVIYDQPHNQMPVGMMNTSVKDGLEVPGLYESYAPGTGVGRDLYDVSLRGIESEGGAGIRSGDNLLEAQATTHTWEHYPDKQLIDNTGIHRYTKTVDGDKVTDKVLVRQPVYKLTTPSSTELPAKSILFSPKIIDNNGVMHINWKDPNVLHTIIPLWTGYKAYETNNSQ